MNELFKFAKQVDADIERRHHGLNHDNFEYVARLSDGACITKAQFSQLKTYGITTLNDGRVIDHTETLLFCC